MTGWGGSPDSKIFKSLRPLVKEVCFNSTPILINVWDINVRFKAGGDAYSIDALTKKYRPNNETFYHRYMINYFGVGDDARIGFAFERKRTGNRFCNKLVYFYEGLKKQFCCCFASPIPLY